ncbi:MAG: hypothetical protein IKQ68_06380 [Prevotella sp.]|nr:hypothetical protein [Prevotella sp.]
MKKVLIFVMLLCCISIQAQEDKTVVEVHMKGSKREITKKLENAGFIETKRNGQKCMVGILAGDTVTIYVTKKTVSSQVIETSAVKVLQVLWDGSALAYANKPGENNNWFNGPVVKLLPKPGLMYYDDLIINTGHNGVLNIVDTYTYETKNNSEKTVPVVEIPDK